MSRIGKVPIQIPIGVEVALAGNMVKVKGPKGGLSIVLSSRVQVTQENGFLVVKRNGNEKEAKAIHGLTRALLNNMVTGVTKGFEKRLQMVGVGFRAQTSGGKITLNIGFSHPVEYTAPEGIKLEIDKEDRNIIIVTGIDKQLVGEVAAHIRKQKKPEPYLGKGIRYLGEYVKRKAGKAVTKAAA